MAAQNSALHTYMFIHVQFAFSESNLVDKEVGKNEVNLSCQSHIVYIGHTSHVKVQIACIYIIYTVYMYHYSLSTNVIIVDM